MRFWQTFSNIVVQEEGSPNEKIHPYGCEAIAQYGLIKL